MRTLSRSGTLTCLLALFGLSCAETPRTQTPPAARERGATVVLVSLDGFRPDYLRRDETPNLHRLATEGVYAPAGMIPVFPSKTFPSHYSIVTGLYPEHHGILSNTMHDPEWDAWYRFRDREAVEDPRWYGGEPIWATAQRQGLRTATFFWVGSEAPIGGVRPTYWKRYDSRIPGTERVEQVLRWLDLPRGERPSFVTLYFSSIDHAAHEHGPDSGEVATVLRRVDSQLGRLITGLEARGPGAAVNLIVVSDHGMAATSPERVIRLDSYIDLRDVEVVERSPVAMLRPRRGKTASVFRALEGAHPHLAVYRREETPEHWHFRDHRRITPLVAVADEGWSIALRSGGAGRDGFPLGMHGYDNALDSMRALFVAHGPAFRTGVEIEPFESIQLYELIARILGIDPAPNDGDTGRLLHLLSSAEGDKRSR